MQLLDKTTPEYKAALRAYNIKTTMIALTVIVMLLSATAMIVTAFMSKWNLVAGFFMLGALLFVALRYFIDMPKTPEQQASADLMQELSRRLGRY